MKTRMILIFSIAILFLACNKEEAKLDLNITTANLNIESGESVDFTIEGSAEFLVFYSGLDGQKIEEYPNGSAESIDIQEASTSFSKRYNLNGKVKAVFVANSYGNWTEDKLNKRFEFDITVSDNNTALKLVSLKTSGLSGALFDGVINADEKEVIVKMPVGTKIKKLTTNIVTDSPLASILLDGVEYTNKSQLDFSATESKTFVVKAIGGKETEWTINIVFE